MAKLSVIIVSYNVTHFLEQCLSSVLSATPLSEKVEIIVVDNNSLDDSCAMVLQKFPEVQLIQNKTNTGFSAANNQGIKESSGEFVLLLNPDTVIAEDTLELCLSFMEKTPDCGALGVKMIDGSGAFLPESKRGLPTPIVSFYKIFGLSKLFPKSETFGQYHLKFLGENEINPIDVLSGAFMFIRKTALEKAGLLDETFFMYGEDVDLSYRIQKAGFQNFYFPKTTIIHYKGESTKRNSLKYVKTFYQAMLIFAEKHFAVKFGKLFGILIHVAVYIRAFLSAARRFAKAASPALLEFMLFYLIYVGVARYWEVYNKFVEGGAYPTEYFGIHLPAYALILILGMSMGGAYKQYFSGKRFWRGIFLGVILLLTVYAFLPENLRYSRAVMMLGAILIAFFGLIVRSTANYFSNKSFVLGSSSTKNFVVIGNKKSYDSAKLIFSKEGKNQHLVGFVSPENFQNNLCLGKIENLQEIIRYYKIDHLVLCAETLKNKQIIALLDSGKLSKCRAFILPEKSNFMIGSSHKNAKGHIYPQPIEFKITNSSSRFNKRFFDVICSLLLLPLLPLISQKLKGGGVQKWWAVFSGKKTWVGYNRSSLQLPQIKPCILEITDSLPSDMNAMTAQKHYALNYSPLLDFEFMMRTLVSK
jgi:GT2 family glycosyltransferase